MTCRIPVAVARGGKVEMDYNAYCNPSRDWHIGEGWTMLQTVISHKPFQGMDG